MPPSGVMSTLLDIKPKPSPLLEPGLEIRYLRYLGFLRFLLDRPELAVRTALKKLFRKEQVREITGKLSKTHLNNRGYNKYLKLTGKVVIAIDYEKFQADQA